MSVKPVIRTVVWQYRTSASSAKSVDLALAQIALENDSDVTKVNRPGRHPVISIQFAHCNAVLFRSGALFMMVDQKSVPFTWVVHRDNASARIALATGHTIQWENPVLGSITVGYEWPEVSPGGRLRRKWHRDGDYGLMWIKQRRMVLVTLGNSARLRYVDISAGTVSKILDRRVRQFRRECLRT